MLKFSDTDPDPGSEIFLTRDPGWKIRIRDKHPGCATLGRRCHLRFPIHIFCFIFAAVFFIQDVLFISGVCVGDSTQKGSGREGRL
jgi:hypothetical protein